jgi:hypothetical protein
MLLHVTWKVSLQPRQNASIIRESFLWLFFLQLAMSHSLKLTSTRSLHYGKARASAPVRSEEIDKVFPPINSRLLYASKHTKSETGEENEIGENVFFGDEKRKFSFAPSLSHTFSQKRHFMKEKKWVTEIGKFS